MKTLKFFSTLLIPVFACCLLLSTCETPSPTTTQSAGNFVIINSENIITNEVWKSDEVHIITAPISVIGSILKIEPGTTVKFRIDASLSIGDSAGLIADGTDNPIRFTSDIKEKGTWKYIYFSSKSIKDSSQLINCIIEYGGADKTRPAAIYCENAAPKITGCTITQSLGAGIILQENCRGIEFHNNTISFCNSEPVRTSARNVPFIGMNSYIDNASNFIKIIDDKLTFDDTWYEQPIPYLLAEGLVVKNAKLSIAPDVQLLFAKNQRLTVSDGGSIRADGTLAPIVFSAAADDYWSGILFEPGANHAGSKLVNCTIEKGGLGGDYSANITLNEAYPEITSCLIQNSNGYGVYHKGDLVTHLFANNIFSDNAFGAISLAANAVANLPTQNFGDDETNFIEVRGGPLEGTITDNGQWENHGVPYKIVNALQITSGTLTLAPGTEILMTESSAIEVRYQGGLIADGSSAPIRIEGEHHIPGYWKYIYFANDANISDCQLINCQIRYGGGDINLPGMIYCDGSAPIIKNCFIEYSKSWGIYVTGNIMLSDLNSNIFYNNVYGDYYSAP